MLCLQDLLLGPPGTAPLLPPDLLDACPLRGDEPRPEPLDPVEEEPPGEKPVERLGSLPLAFYGKAGRHVDKVDAGRGLVDLLTAGSGGADEGFAEFLLPDAEALHPLAERRFFFLEK